jgi:hypothetical protein
MICRWVLCWGYCDWRCCLVTSTQWHSDDGNDGYFRCEEHDLVVVQRTMSSVIGSVSHSLVSWTHRAWVSAMREKNCTVKPFFLSRASLAVSHVIKLPGCLPGLSVVSNFAAVSCVFEKDFSARRESGGLVRVGEKLEWEEVGEGKRTAGFTARNVRR